MINDASKNYEVRARELFNIIDGGTTKDTKERGVKDERISRYEMQVANLPFIIGYSGVTEDEFVELYKSYMSNLNSETEQNAFLEQCETVKSRYEEINEKCKTEGVSILEDAEGVKHYIIDNGFTNQFALADPDPMQFYDESKLTSEDKDTIEAFKAFCDNHDAVRANWIALSKIKAELTAINFESL